MTNLTWIHHGVNLWLPPSLSLCLHLSGLLSSSSVLLSWVRREPGPHVLLSDNCWIGERLMPPEQRSTGTASAVLLELCVRLWGSPVLLWLISHSLAPKHTPTRQHRHTHTWTHKHSLAHSHTLLQLFGTSPLALLWCFDVQSLYCVLYRRLLKICYAVVQLVGVFYGFCVCIWFIYICWNCPFDSDFVVIRSEAADIAVNFLSVWFLKLK